MTTAIANTTTTIKIGDFGDGRYSPLMKECFSDAKRLLGLEDEAADKLARQIGSDFGAEMRNVKVDTKSKITGKDNKMTLREAATKKNVTATNALNVMHALAWINDSKKNGVDAGATKWSLNEELSEYIADL